MTPRELLCDLPLGPGDTRHALLHARLLVSYLADHVYTAELKEGGRLRDSTDFTAWLRELANEARILLQNGSGSTEVSLRQELSASPRAAAPSSQSRWRDGACPDCYHEHEGAEECGYYLGEGKFCKCPTKRAA